MNSDHPKLKFLLVYSGFSDDIIKWHENYIKRCRSNGVNINSLCYIPNVSHSELSYSRLDELWAKNNKSIRNLYLKLKKITPDYDILIIYNGVNIHPEWLKEFSTFNIFISWDDPIFLNNLSQHIAKYFDFIFTGNAACVPLYQSWGVKCCDFLPRCASSDEFDNQMTINRILEDNRDIDIIFLGECESLSRKSRLDNLKTAFPQALMRGRGWLEGFLPKNQKISTLTRSKIGWNIHNSVGPVNLQTYSLPANGVLEICDNKCRLGSIFKLNQEVIGFDSIDECIELTQYYLEHDEERKKIAARGFERVMRDYTEEMQWKLITNKIQPFYQFKKENLLNTPVYEKSINVSWKTEIENSIKSKILSFARKRGIEIKRIKPKNISPIKQNFYDVFYDDNLYIENSESGPSNFESKLERLKEGKFFEWPNMIALNWAVASLVGSSKKIVELGSGTGCFAFEVTSDPSRFVLCSELDNGAREWANQNRKRSNIKYINYIPTNDDGEFDIVVAIDVIEHIHDFKKFLITCTNLAPKAIITTPNKSRNYESLICNPPAYQHHVREWTAGEFYWVLRNYYDSIKLYSMPNEYLPSVIPIKVTDTMTPLIALCDRSN